MCGIAGSFDMHALGCDKVAQLVKAVSFMQSRGPDGSGVWSDGEAGIGLGHARLSILDVSVLGRQPMQSRCERYVITYNGEVYNYLVLASELEALGYVFRGGSDTEVILAAIVEWGIEAAVGKFVGMFAFALWDRAERELILVRDRLGVKPLYVGLKGQKLVFGSGLKVFRAMEDFELSVSRNALTLLLRHNCIPAPHSIFEGVQKLRPGHILRVRRSDLEKGALPVSLSFWDAKEVVQSRGGGAFEGTLEEAVEGLEGHLRDAVRARMIADVPLGAFLSGGIDSSLVVSLMQSQSTRPVKTFSIGFGEKSFNEAVFASEVARHLGTEHTELYVTQRDAQNVIPGLPDIFDEPFSDSSQIPTFLVSKLARQHVTVALSGDGGDEVFGGYNRYVTGGRIWGQFANSPQFFRLLGSRALSMLSESRWDQLFAGLAPILPKRMHLQLPGHRAHKLAEAMNFTRPEQMYLSLVSHWKDPSNIVIGGREPATNLTDSNFQLSSEVTDFREMMMYLDLITYLPDDILTKVDRASMASSLEARVPLLDHRVVEFAWSLPMDYKIRNGEGKWILRQVLDKYAPRQLFERPKMGFGVPLGDWLRGDLRDWAEDLLNENRLSREGYFHPRPIRQLWSDHLSRHGDFSYLLWDILMFQAWRAN